MKLKLFVRAVYHFYRIARLRVFMHLRVQNVQNNIQSYVYKISQPNLYLSKSHIFISIVVSGKFRYKYFLILFIIYLQ